MKFAFINIERKRFHSSVFKTITKNLEQYVTFEKKDQLWKIYIRSVLFMLLLMGASLFTILYILLFQYTSYCPGEPINTVFFDIS